MYDILIFIYLIHHTLIKYVVKDPESKIIVSFYNICTKNEISMEYRSYIST